MAGFINDSDVLHIFRDAVGHVPDTAQNRRLLIETSIRPIFPETTDSAIRGMLGR